MLPSATTPTTTEKVEQDAYPREQGDDPAHKHVPLAMTFEELLGADITPDETADDIIRAIREWRDTPSNRSLS